MKSYIKWRIGATIVGVLILAALGATFYLFWLIIKALEKYVNS